MPRQEAVTNHPPGFHSELPTVNEELPEINAASKGKKQIQELAVENEKDQSDKNEPGPSDSERDLMKM